MNKSSERNYKSQKSRKDVIMPAPSLMSQMPESYTLFFNNLKERIRQERLKVVLSANSALIILYWGIGFSILKKQNITTAELAKEIGISDGAVKKQMASLKQDYPL